jgi:hypothetical protein
MACMTAWEKGWSRSWRLLSVREAEIDEFMLGVVMVWERVEGELVRVRTEALTPGGRFYSAHESVRRGPNETARGSVHFDRVGRLRYRNFVRLSGTHPPDWSDPGNPMAENDILAYELDAFCAGDVESRYESQTNFLIDDESLELLRVPGDTKLIGGPLCPAVESARSK